MRRQALELNRDRAGRRRSAAWVGAACLWLAASATQAGLLSETYRFKQNVTLDVGATTDERLRIDSLRFDFPSAVGGKLMRTSGLVQARVSISNTSAVTHKVGVALALFDAEGRLVGVASGGSRVAGLKPGRQRTYNLVFDSVNAEAHKATTFQISVEAR